MMLTRLTDNCAKQINLERVVLFGKILLFVGKFANILGVNLPSENPRFDNAVTMILDESKQHVQFCVNLR